MIVYRLAAVTALYGIQNSTAKTHARLIISVTASVINLIVCMILSKVRLFSTVYSAVRPSRRNDLITMRCDTEYLACAEALRGSVSGSGDLPF